MKNYYFGNLLSVTTRSGDGHSSDRVASEKRDVVYKLNKLKTSICIRFLKTSQTKLTVKTFNDDNFRPDDCLSNPLLRKDFRAL